MSPMGMNLCRLSANTAASRAKGTAALDCLSTFTPHPSPSRAALHLPSARLSRRRAVQVIQHSPIRRLCSTKFHLNHRGRSPPHEQIHLFLARRIALFLFAWGYKKHTTTSLPLLVFSSTTTQFPTSVPPPKTTNHHTLIMAPLIHALTTLLLALSGMASPAVVAIHEPRASAATPNQKSEVANLEWSRRLTANTYSTALNCGIFSTADKHDFMDLQSAWGVHKDDMCTTPAKSCRRHACKNTSGIYVRLFQSLAGT